MIHRIANALRDREECRYKHHICRVSEMSIHDGRVSGRSEDNWTYAGLGLAGEMGKVCEKLKKIIRDHGGRVDAERLVALKKELGDVLWCLAALCPELGLDLQDVAEMNLANFADRRQKARLHGEGDER